MTVTLRQVAGVSATGQEETVKVFYVEVR